MEERALLNYDASVFHTVLFVLAIVSVALPAALWGFVLGLWTGRLRFVLEQVADFGVRGVLGLQGICVLAYAVPGWTFDSSRFLRCAESWVWFDYFDGLIEDAEDILFTESLPGDLSGFSFNHWSPAHYGNSFTATAGVLLATALCLLYWLALRFCCELKCRCLQLEPVVKTVQLVHMRLCLSLLLEIRFLDNGKKGHWSSSTGIAFSFMVVILLPLILLAVTMLKRPVALEEEQMNGLYGSLFREYKGGCRAIYIHLGYAENVAMAVAVCILGQWKSAQAYLMLVVVALSWAEIVIFRPFRLPEHNLEESVLRLIKFLLVLMLVLVYEEVDLTPEEQSAAIFILVLFWLLGQIAAGLTLTIVSLRHVRGLFLDETFENFIYERPPANSDQSPKPSTADFNKELPQSKEPSETSSHPRPEDQVS